MKKIGIDRPMKEKAVTTTSRTEYWRRAAMTPIDMPKTRMIIWAGIIKIRVLGMRSQISSMTGVPRLTIEVPKSPRTTPLRSPGVSGTPSPSMSTLVQSFPTSQ